MRDIRQKPEDREPKTLKRASRISKTFLRDIAEKSRAKTVEEMRSAPFDSRQEESSNTPANNAGEQMVSTGKNIVQKGADLAFRGGKNLARKMRERAVYRVKQRTQGIRRNTGKDQNIRENSFSAHSPETHSSPSEPGAGNPRAAQTRMRASRQSFSRTGKDAPHFSAQQTTVLPHVTNPSSHSKGRDSPPFGCFSAERKLPRCPDVKRQGFPIREKPKWGVQTVRRAVRQSEKKIRTAQKTVQKARRTQKVAARSAKRSQQAARTSAKAAKTAIRAIVTAGKAAVAAFRTLAAALIAGGWMAVVVVLVICVIGLLVGSVYGIFADDSLTAGQGIPVRQAVAMLDEEFQDRIDSLSRSIPHDRRNITSKDGSASVQWEDVLSVFAARISGDLSQTPITTLTDAQLTDLRTLMWEMTEIAPDTHTETHTETVTEIDENGNEKTHIEMVREKILTLEISHKTPQEMATAYAFSDRQNSYLALLTSSDTDPLWEQLLGSHSTGAGEIISPDTTWEGTGIFQWPLPESFTITSYFGNREDPFTGEPSYHDGTDIAAPAGTPILAAADGTVEVANSTDAWGGGYGYYVKIRHNGSLETLYAHCSSICVSAGQKVKQGEVIAYVGTTGNSTGNHLHFEVRVDGKKTDALAYFKKAG